MVRRKSLSGPRDSAGVSLSMEGLAMSLEHSPGRYSDFDSVRIIRDGDMPDIIWYVAVILAADEARWRLSTGHSSFSAPSRLQTFRCEVWLDKKQGA